MLLGVQINPSTPRWVYGSPAPPPRPSLTQVVQDVFSEKVYVYCTQCTQLSQQADDGSVKYESFLQSSPSRRQWRQIRVVSTEFTPSHGKTALAAGKHGPAGYL